MTTPRDRYLEFQAKTQSGYVAPSLVLTESAKPRRPIAAYTILVIVLTIILIVVLVAILLVVIERRRQRQLDAKNST